VESLLKVLQVCNVASMTGGTANCAWSITKALPDMRHRVHFLGRTIPDSVSAAFSGCELTGGHKIDSEILSSVDLAIFHNTGPNLFPQYIPDNLATVYYQHSAFPAAAGIRKRCSKVFSVSKWLAKECGLKDSDVLHQPVPIPPTRDKWPENERIRVTRFCTPNPQKWDEKDVLPFYRQLFTKIPDVDWTFVGAPHPVEMKLRNIAAEAIATVTFEDASHGQRSILHTSDVLIHHSSVTESYGRTICEAQRCGCYPIVDNRGGFVEQIENRLTGALCDHESDFIFELQYFIDSTKDGHSFKEILKLNGNARGALSVWRHKFLSALKGKA
jgi:hypothetical protein